MLALKKTNRNFPCAFAYVFVFAAIFFASIVVSSAADEKPETRQMLARAIVSEGDEQTKIIAQLADTGSELVQKVLTAWPREDVKIYQNPNDPNAAKIPVLLDETQLDADGKLRAVRIDNGEVLKNENGQPLFFASGDLKSADTDMKLRRAIKNTLDLLSLADPDPAARRSAVMKLGMTQQKQNLPILQARLEKERDSNVRKALNEAIAIIQLKDSQPEIQIAAIKKLAALNSISSLDLLKKIAADPQTKSKPELQLAVGSAVTSIQRYISQVNFFGTIFRGFSLGSILLVVALGLAITFGLMGIINMAHGELIAVGAYACYVVENVFGAGLWLSPFGKFSLHLPGLNFGGWLYQSYFLVAIPVAFFSAAFVGLILERCVIRFLYRRPLESLLATWGVSLLLQQLFRSFFGANNVQVNSPRWLLGNFTLHDVTLGYNRLFVIAFAALIVFGTHLILTKTPLGLLIRAVMQNRDMAACMGVRTERVNMLTFAFGSGLAGLAGAFLSQIGNVGPSLGQSYIVDCFMTVVVGGVGNLAGTVWSALGIGVTDQSLQQVLLNPVLGKIIVLGAIILFLQWKPGGLFPTRSRSLEG